MNNASNINSINYKQPPADLLRVAERIMPRLFLRLVQYLRENRYILYNIYCYINSNLLLILNTTYSKIADSRIGNTLLTSDVTNAGINRPQNVFLSDLDPFLGMLNDFSALGAAMRRVMTVSLINEKVCR